MNARKPAPGVLIILTGPTASGKTEVRERMIAKYKGLESLVTTTSRSIRTNSQDGKSPEIDGVDYHFVTPDKFLEMEENGEFVEHVLYPGGLYGTTKKELERIFSGQSLISTMEISGAAEFSNNIKEVYDLEKAAIILSRAFVIYIELESEHIQRKRHEKRKLGLGDLETRIVQDKLLEEKYGNCFKERVVNLDGKIDDTIYRIEQLIEARFQVSPAVLFG